MKCFRCGIDLPEELIQESHDVPCYLFEGCRREQKNQADKFGRHWLCGKCHKGYEERLRIFLRDKSKEFMIYFFQEGEKDGNTNTK